MNMVKWDNWIFFDGFGELDEFYELIELDEFGKLYEQNELDKFE